MNKTENRKDEFDLALENMKLEPEADLDRLIEKRVKQMMTRISLKVVCVALLVLALVFLGVNPLVNLCNVNPARANEAEEGRASELLQTLSAYVETVYPQTRLHTIGEIEKAGFGKYEIPLCVSTRTQRTYVGKMNVILEMTRGKLEVKSDADGALTHIGHTTVSNAKLEGIGDFAAYNEATIKDLAELPKSARVLLNVRLREAKALEDTPVDASATEIQQITEIFDELGESLIMEERLFPAATAMSCAIAYAMRYVRANVEGGVEMGFKAKDAQKIVLQTIKGAVELLQETGEHPEAAIDKVTTPGGCTIKGLNTMEQNGFTNAVIKGLIAGNK